MRVETSGRRIKGVLFDMDGTIVDVSYDWTRIKAELETDGEPILFFLESLPEPEKTRKWRILEAHEKKATARAVLKKGVRSLLRDLEERRIKTALVTNNSRRNVDILLRKFDLRFDCVVSRESGLWKPSGEPLLFAAGKLGLSREECCVVGDSHFDVQAARDAGISRMFLIDGDASRFRDGDVVAVSSVEALHAALIPLLQEA